MSRNDVHAQQRFVVRDAIAQMVQLRHEAVEFSAVRARLETAMKMRNPRR